jgi:uncharacterized glyoxalase superfamily metalloenzyme YdcJ
MSIMYQQEVPLYGQLIDLVVDTNKDFLFRRPDIENTRKQTNTLMRIEEERHGAIRLGKASELYAIRRLFALMGMHPVGYYDLSVAGIPVHSTAFRPITQTALSISPFRIFTSLLRIELLDDDGLRYRAENILATRTIFSEELVTMIDLAEIQGGILLADAEKFIDAAVNVFRWHNEALVNAEVYAELLQAHRLVADVVAFKGPHINHLTPASLDIDSVQHAMLAIGMEPKAVIEGPPLRQCPLLLRQTSFKALEETIFFPSEQERIVGAHTARFGEVEQRGIALTPKGQQLYDTLLAQAREIMQPSANGDNALDYMALLQQQFSVFPDDYAQLRELRLAYFYYSVCDTSMDKNLAQGMDIEQLISHNYVRYDPLLYEDFLPVSAAGIFQSNLATSNTLLPLLKSSQQVFEDALGEPVIDFFVLYADQQQQSIDLCLRFFAT